MKTLRERAQELRRQGLTYNEIQLSLNMSIPKGTMSYWCKDILLNQEQQARIRMINRTHLISARKTAARSIANIQLLKHQAAFERARHVMDTEIISTREAKIALSMLYLGEGNKYPSYRGLRLGSVDPQILLIYISLIQKCFGINRQDLKCEINYRADQNQESLIQYWSIILGIPEMNFYRTIPDPRTANKPTKNSDYHGVAVITCKGVAHQLELAKIAGVLLDKLRV